MELVPFLNIVYGVVVAPRMSFESPVSPALRSVFQTECLVDASSESGCFPLRWLSMLMVSVVFLSDADLSQVLKNLENRILDLGPASLRGHVAIFVDGKLFSSKFK